MSKTVPFQTIHLSISSVFFVYTQLNLKKFNFKQFILVHKKSYLTHIKDPSGVTPPGQSEPESDGKEGILCISKSIRLFSIISRILFGRSLIPLQRSSWCILPPKPSNKIKYEILIRIHYSFFNRNIRSSFKLSLTGLNSELFIF